MVFILLTRLSYLVFVTISLSVTLLGLFKSAGTVFRLSKSILSTAAFKEAVFDFALKLDISTPVGPSKSAFVV